MDGKTLRGSRCALRPAGHLLSVFDQATGRVLSQAPVGDKTNEPKAARALLEALVLEGRVVTADAIFCQKELARQVRGQAPQAMAALRNATLSLLRLAKVSNVAAALREHAYRGAALVFATLGIVNL